MRLIGTTEPFKKDFFQRQFPRIKAFFNGKVIPPYEVEIQPSSTCSAKCNFCWGQDALKRAGRLKDLLKAGENMRIVIDKVLEAEEEGFQVEVVKFVGSTGDPLENPKTLDAVDLLIEKKREARLFTNGIGLTYQTAKGQTYAERLVRLNYLRISLDAGSSETLYKVKGRKEFDGIMKGITAVRKLSDTTKTGISIYGGFVISPLNYQDIRIAAEEVKEAGANGIQYRRDLTGSNFTPKEKEEIEKQLDMVQSLADNSFKVTKVDDPIALAKECFYPFFWTTVGSDGCLYPCGHRGLDFNWHLGNLLEFGVSLMDLLQRQRKELILQEGKHRLPDKNCRFCPPTGLHASNLMNDLTAISQQPGFQNRLDAMYRSLLGGDDLQITN